MARLVCVSVLLVAALLSLCGAANTDRGILYVDDLTFRQIAAAPIAHPIFMRFDKEYSWGAENDAFKTLGVTVASSNSGVLVIGLPISKRDHEPENADLGASFGIKEEDYPKFVLLMPNLWDGTPASALRYSGPVEEGAMLRWIVAKTGAFIGLKGQLKELDALARALVAPGADVVAVGKQVEAALQAVPAKDEEHAKYYARLFKKVADEPGWVVTEEKRLTKMIGAAKGVTQAMKDAMQVKLHVLASFLPPATTKKEEL